MSLKNPVTPPGIDPGTVRLVRQRLLYTEIVYKNIIYKYIKYVGGMKPQHMEQETKLQQSYQQTVRTRV